jgi:hypothetical protein
MSPAPTPDRRRNRPLRDQAQAWFDALKPCIADLAGAEAIATLMKGWHRPEDVMRDYPSLVPLFLDLVWCSRKLPAFADLFRTPTGDVAEATTEILALSQKTFDEIVIAHLMGTMRLTCERRQNAWLVAEHIRRRRGLAKLPVIGTILRTFGLVAPPKTDELLTAYPQKGLYGALKPFLHRREQFAVVEALAELPTRTIGLLGPVPGVLESAEVIRTLANLDTGMVKVAIEMAETYVQAEGTGTAPEDYAAPRGAALSALLRAGTRFLKLAADHRQLARDAVTKLGPRRRRRLDALSRSRILAARRRMSRRRRRRPEALDCRGRSAGLGRPRRDHRRSRVHPCLQRDAEDRAARHLARMAA